MVRLLYVFSKSRLNSAYSASFESALAAYSVAQARPLGEQGCVWSLQNFNEVDHMREAGMLVR